MQFSFTGNFQQQNYNPTETPAKLLIFNLWQR